MHRFFFCFLIKKYIYILKYIFRNCLRIFLEKMRTCSGHSAGCLDSCLYRLYFADKTFSPLIYWRHTQGKIAHHPFTTFTTLRLPLLLRSDRTLELLVPETTWCNVGTFLAIIMHEQIKISIRLQNSS